MQTASLAGLLLLLLLLLLAASLQETTDSRQPHLALRSSKLRTKLGQLCQQRRVLRKAARILSSDVVAAGVTRALQRQHCCRQAHQASGLRSRATQPRLPCRERRLQGVNSALLNNQAGELLPAMGGVQCFTCRLQTATSTQQTCGHVPTCTAAACWGADAAMAPGSRCASAAVRAAHSAYGACSCSRAATDVSST